MRNDDAILCLNRFGIKSDVLFKKSLISVCYLIYAISVKSEMSSSGSYIFCEHNYHPTWRGT